MVGRALGRGGAGVVHAAEHRESGRRAAVKLAHPDAGAIRNHWFQREATLAARLRHPHIVTLIEWGFERERPYLVYERVEGHDLAEVADEMGLPEIVRLGVELLSALGYAHDAGVVHCDVTPANVMIDRDGAVKLSDFGLAKAGNESRTRRLAGDRLVSGTPGYLSPEQASGVGSPGPASDLFGCGALLYRALTGDAPYAGKSAVEIVQKTLTLPPRPLHARQRLAAPDALGEVVQRLLARDPGQRYPSAARASQAWLAAAAAAAPGRAAPGRRESGAPPALAGLQAMETMLAANLGTETLAEGAIPSTVRARPAAAAARPVATPATVALHRPAVCAAVMKGLGADLGHVVALRGPRGAGLDDVVADVRRELRDQGHRVCYARGRRGGMCAPFEALASVVLDGLAAGDLSGLRHGVEVLAERARQTGLDQALRGRDALVGGLLGVGPIGARGSAVMDAFAVAESLLVREGRPLVIVLADADGVDRETLEVIRALVQRPDGGVGALVVRHETTAGEGEVSVEVAAPDSAALDVAWAKWSHGGPQVRPAVTSVADLHALAVLGNLGAIGFDDYLAGADPTTLAVLRAAAVFGGDVPKRGAVAVAAGFSDRELVEDRLRGLSAAGLLVDVAGACARREAWLRLSSPGLRQAVLDGLDEVEGRRYLTAAAQWLSRHSLDDSATNQARVAALAEQAGLRGSAAYALTEAARVELESGRTRAAAPYLDAAVRLAAGEARDAIDHARARGWLAEAALVAGDLSGADAHIAAALDAVEEGRPVLVARLLHCRADAAVHGGQYDLALGYLDEALEALGEEGDPMELARVHSLIGWILGYRLGRNVEGIAHGQRALDVAARISAPAFQASLCGRLGANYLRAGDWDGQLETNRKDLRLSTEARDTGGVVRANINLGVCLHNRGFLDLARDHTQRARDLAQRTGDGSARQIADNNLAMIALDDGRDDDVDRHTGAVFESADRTGYHRALPETLITLARLATRRRDFDAAADYLTRAEEGSDVADAEMARRAGALLALGRGDLEGAAEEVAVVFASPAHDPYERALSGITRGAVLRAMGREDDAAGVEEEADRVFEVLGADRALERRRWGTSRG